MVEHTDQLGPPAGEAGSQETAHSVFTIRTSKGTRDVDAYSEDGFRILSDLWTRSGWQRKLSYEVTWLGIPIIQMPEDMVMLQELIWKVRPDVIVESGVAHGGALILYASMLELLGRGRVVGVDIEIRKYNRLAIESHPLSKRITLLEGDSVEPGVLDDVRALIRPEETVMVMLDSNHTREHVERELNSYAPLVTPGSYVVVFDEVIRRVAGAPRGSSQWVTDNPAEAISSFLKNHPEFEADPKYERLEVTYCRGGFLRRVGGSISSNIERTAEPTNRKEPAG